MDEILRLAAQLESAAATPDDPSDAHLVERFLTQPALAYCELLERYTAVILRMIRRSFRDQDEVMEVYTAVCERLRAGDYLALRRFRVGVPIMPWLSVVVANACRDRLRRKHVGAVPRSLAAHLDAREQLIYKYHFGHRVPPEDVAEMVARQGMPCSPLDVVATVDRIQSLLGTAQRYRLLRGIAAKRTAESLDVLIDQGLERASDPAEGLDAALSERERVDLLGEALQALTAEDQLLIQLRFEQEMSAPEIAQVLDYADYKVVYTRLRTILNRLRRVLEARGV